MWADAVERLAEICGPNSHMITWKQDGMIVLGAPIGTDEYESKVCLEKVLGCATLPDADPECTVYKATIIRRLCDP